MIEHRTGSLFDSGAQALVVPVNCNGVAGRGLAWEFRERYPEWHKAYRRACGSGEIRIGGVVPHRIGDKLMIFDFPTKGHWRNPSSLFNIYRGLNDASKGLRARLRYCPALESIAVPALGCGLGGLDWNEVRPLIEKALGGLELRVLLYGPKED